MPARILLAAAEPGARVAEAALRREGHDLTLAAQGADALRSWNEGSVDLMVIDTGLPGVSGFDLARRIREEEGEKRHTPLVLTGPADMASKIQALRAGADDYVSAPIHPQELSARVRALLVRYGGGHGFGARDDALGRLVAFYGAKGGVGTTTLALNTAIALARQTKRSVALIDANLQFGDHRVFFDLGNDKRSIVDACTATAIDADVISKVLVAHESGVDLMLAPTKPESAELVNAEQHHLLQVVEVLRSKYDYVVVDLDQRLDDNALDVIGAVDKLLVVMTADLSCIKNVRLLLETMGQIGVPPERMELVMNRNKAFTGVSVKSAESVLRRPIVHLVVNDYRTAISALNNGTPFMLNQADSPIGKAVRELARSIASEPKAEDARQPKKLAAVAG
jgi:pilus assembly protein CpaE